jgi:hypothetical protein
MLWIKASGGIAWGFLVALQRPSPMGGFIGIIGRIFPLPIDEIFG